MTSSPDESLLRAVIRRADIAARIGDYFGVRSSCWLFALKYIMQHQHDRYENHSLRRALPLKQNT